MLLRIGPFFKKFLPVVIWNMNTASMFMPNPTVVTLRLLPNILRICRSCHCQFASILIPGGILSFIANRHEDDQHVQETIPVMDFIKRLIRTSPKTFQDDPLWRPLCQTSPIDKNSISLFRKRKTAYFPSCFNRWRTAILSSFGYDPLDLSSL